MLQKHPMFMWSEKQNETKKETNKQTLSLSGWIKYLMLAEQFPSTGNFDENMMRSNFTFSMISYLFLNSSISLAN